MLSLSSWLFALLALIAGSLVPFQSAGNAALGRALGHPLWASVVSLWVSLMVIMPVLLLLRVPAPTFSHTVHLPFWGWLGGVAGVIFISAALLLTPRMGAANFIVCVIAGQMLTSLLIDHFGWVGLPVKEAHWGRVMGVMVMFVGLLMVQWFTPPTQSQGLADMAPALDERAK